MGKTMKLLAVLVLIFSMLVGCTPASPTTTNDPDADLYFEEVYDNPLKDRDMGGSDVLTLSQQGDDVTLENENIRLVLDYQTGGIKQIANKQANVYLVDGQASTPFTLCHVSGTAESAYYSDCTVTLDDSNANSKSIAITWQVTDVIRVYATVTLDKGDDQLQFRVNVDNDTERPIWYVQYPVVEGIGTLYEKERDYLAHPIATGFLFNNPLDNFNSGSFEGITRSEGLYPSGWECPMQFFAYYSQGIGGFMFRTDDGGNGIKSFSFMGKDDALKAGIYHYADDLADAKIQFNYTTYIGNLNQGHWYEAADLYRDWASEQSWTSMGTLAERTDINLTFYEDTVLCNFNFPYDTIYGTENQTALYDKIKAAADGTMLNIFFNADNFLTQSQKNKDLHAQFEFPSFHSVKSAEETPSEWLTAIKNRLGNLYYYNVEDAIQFYECPSCDAYLEAFWERENHQLVYNKVSGFYHDVGVAAVHPRQCFDTEHPHGTRVNILQEFLDQMEATRLLGSEKTQGIYGQELVFEQMLPYTDFYQARANAAQVGFMEIDRFRELVINGSCTNINMFDYVYGSYGAVRLDGFLNADELIGESYYHIAAYTVLMGGIPEFNYEFVVNGNYLTVEEHADDMLAYIGYLGNIRQGYGKDYLVYGQMVKPPLASDETIEYDYIQQRVAGGVAGPGLVTGGDADGGPITWSKVITSAYRWEDTIGVFVGNPTNKSQQLNFIIHAQQDYGISEGTVELIDENGNTVLCSIENGIAKVSLDLDARQVVLLKLEADK